MMSATLFYGILRIVLAAIIIFFGNIRNAVRRLTNMQVLLILFGTLALIVFLEGIYVLSTTTIK